LKDKKIAEATQFLTAVAEDKSAQAEQAVAQAEKDRKEAAIAYRNLGAIAGLRDPQSALQAYEKVALLDPGDMESLLWAGWLEIDHGDLNKAQMRLERFLKLAEEGNQADYKYWARIGLADIWQKRGDLAAALKSYSDSLAMVERLAKSDPGNLEWQRDLSVSYEKIGGVQVAEGDLKVALKSYSDSLALRERLARSDPGNTGWQRDLAVSYETIGGAYRKLNDTSKARQALAVARAIIGTLVEQHPDQRQWKQDLARFDAQIAELENTSRKKNRAR
jgi:tetratricopeptide (TPR) repeat protein